MTPYHHSLSSARRWGGVAEDYLAVHEWLDASKSHYADIRHRALRHHDEGIFLCESLLGTTITNSDGRAVPVRTIAERHVPEDLGWIPTVKDWLQHIQKVPWMLRIAVRPRDIIDRSDVPAEAIEQDFPTESCPDCGAQQGEWHRDDCHIEPCPACGRQLVRCSCTAKSPGDRIPWSGCWPGVEECLEYGWYARMGPGGWVRCEADEPGAEPDLNRLRSEARWDRSLGRFIRN